MEADESTTGLSCLPHELLATICSHLSVRQVHRLRLNRALRSFVDSWANLDEVSTGRHALLFPQATCRQGMEIERRIDSEGRAWGRALCHTERYVREEFWFDGKCTGTVAEFKVFDDDIYEVKTTRRLDGTVDRATRVLGEVVSVTNGAKRTEIGKDWCRIFIIEGSTLHWVLGEETSCSLSFSHSRIFRMSIPDRNFSIVTRDFPATVINWNHEGTFSFGIDGGKYVASGSVDPIGKGRERCASVSFASKEGRRVASVHIGVDDVRIGFELDGWNETTYPFPLRVPTCWDDPTPCT